MASADVSTTDGASPVPIQRMMYIYELLEKVLLYMPLNEVLTSQRVCKAWHETINSSGCLQRKLFLRPSSFALLRDEARTGLQTLDGRACIAPDGTTVAINPFLDHLWPDFRSGSHIGNSVHVFNEPFCAAVPTHWAENIDEQRRLPLRLSTNITLSSRSGQDPLKIYSNTALRCKWKGGSWEKMFFTQPPSPTLSWFTGYVTGDDHILGGRITGASINGCLRSSSGITFGSIHAFDRRLITHMNITASQLKYLQLTLGDVKLVDENTVVMIRGTSDAKAPITPSQDSPFQDSGTVGFSTPKSKPLNTSRILWAPKKPYRAPRKPIDLGPVIKLRPIDIHDFDWNKAFKHFDFEDIKVVNDALVSMKLTPIVHSMVDGWHVATADYLVNCTLPAHYLLSPKGFSMLEDTLVCRGEWECNDMMGY